MFRQLNSVQVRNMGVSCINAPIVLLIWWNAKLELISKKNNIKILYILFIKIVIISFEINKSFSGFFIDVNVIDVSHHSIFSGKTPMAYGAYMWSFTCMLCSHMPFHIGFIFAFRRLRTKGALIHKPPRFLTITEFNWLNNLQKTWIFFNLEINLN